MISFFNFQWADRTQDRFRTENKYRARRLPRSVAKLSMAKTMDDGSGTAPPLAPSPPPVPLPGVLPKLARQMS